MGERYDDGKGLAMLIAGFGLGTLVGTVIGLLVAPKSGRELRGDIAEYSKDYYDKARDFGRDAYEAGRDKARRAYETGREKATTYGNRVGEKVSDAREAVHDTANRYSSAVKTGFETAREVLREGEQEGA